MTASSPPFERLATEPRLSHEDLPRVNIVEWRDDQRRQRAAIFLRRQERVFALEDFPTLDDRGVERQAATKVRSRYLRGGCPRNGSPQRERNSTGDADADSNCPRQGTSSPLSPQQRNRDSVGSVGSPRTMRRGSTSNMGSRGGPSEAGRDAVASDRFGGGRRGSSVEDFSRGVYLSREL
jgi:hypothetical protein